MLKSTVCADSAALGDAGVNNNSMTVASDEREKVSEGVCVNLIDSSKAASAINLMLIIISWILLKSICKIKILSQKHFFFIWYLKNNMHNILLVNIYGQEVQAFLVLSQPSA